MPIYDGLNDFGVAASKKAGTEDLGQGTQGGQYPLDVTATSWGRLEPLLTPDLLKSRYLKGIPMTLKIKDVDGKHFKITDDELKDYIELAVDEAENELQLTLMPTQVTQKLPFQRQDYEQFGYFQLSHRPISSIEALNVTLADGSDVFVFPPQWLETANLVAGQLNIIPLAFQGGQGGTGVIGGIDSAGSGTAVFFNSLWNRPWVAALFGVTYTAGFINGLMPKYVNNLLGCIVAMRVLSMIAAAYAGATSTSLGLDGMSQSVGTPGPNRYQVRMGELEKERALCVKKLKKQFGASFVVGTV
jgi:hypothetical protein